MSAAELGIGTFLQYGSGGASPETYTTVAENLDFQVGSSSELVEVTNHQSPNRTREYIAGLKDGEEFSVECNLIADDDTQRHVFEAQESGAVEGWRIYETHEDGSNREWRFDAIVLGYSAAFPVASQKKVTFTFKVSGPIIRWNW